MPVEVFPCVRAASFFLNNNYQTNNHCFVREGIYKLWRAHCYIFVTFKEKNEK